MPYHIMHSNFERFNNPRVARYVKGKLCVSGVPPIDFTGETLDWSNLQVDDEPMPIEQQVELVNALLAEPASGRLVIISEQLGQWLYANHPAFMPIVDEEPTTP